MLLTVVFAFFAGLVTVASPCILPVLPIVLSAGVAEGRRRPLAVVLGLVISFTIFTLAISQIVAALGLPANTLRLIAVVVIAALGLALLVPALNQRFEMLLARLPGLAPQRSRSGWLGGLLTGASLGLVWAPCAGPVLAAITTLAATRQVTTAAVAVTLAYGLGVGVPLLLVAYGGQVARRRIPSLARHTPALQRTFGVVMIVMALLVAFNLDVTFTAWATAALPAGWNDRLQAFEDTPLARAQLDHLTGRSGPTSGSAAGSAIGGSAVQAAAPGATTAATSNDSAAAAPSPMTDAPAAAVASATPAPAAPVTPAAGEAVTAQPAPRATPTPAPPAAPKVALEDMGPAPDFAGITHWINSAPLTMAQLRGKVVLVDFWTYSCINCIRTLPYVTGWYNKYHDQGFVVVGVHTPEFAFEQQTGNVEQAAARYGIKYPIAQDNNYATWNAYANRYWPADYLIDSKGHVRDVHFGEGNYDQTEAAIQELLAEAGAKAAANSLMPAATPPFAADETPETYLGSDRQENFASSEQVTAGGTTYALPASLDRDQWAVAGQWTFDPAFARADAAGDVLRLHFNARDVYLVLSSPAPATVTVTLAGQTAAVQTEDVTQGRLAVSQARLYHLVHLNAVQEGTLDLRFDQPGVQAYAFTFGG